MALLNLAPSLPNLSPSTSPSPSPNPTLRLTTPSSPSPYPSRYLSPWPGARSRVDELHTGAAGREEQGKDAPLRHLPPQASARALLRGGGPPPFRRCALTMLPCPTLTPTPTLPPTLAHALSPGP